MDQTLDTLDLSLNDLEVLDVKVQALTLDDAKGLPEMGATCG